MATLKFLDDRNAVMRIISAAVFVKIGDIIDATTAIVSDANITRNGKPQMNVSFRKLTVLDEQLFNRILNRVTKGKGLKTNTEKLESLTTEQLAAILQLCRVGSYMCNSDSREASFGGEMLKFAIGAQNRTSTVVGSEEDSITSMCCEILDLPVREIQVAAITGLQKVELVATRQIGRTTENRFADWDDDDDDFADPDETYTAEMLRNLSNDQLKAVMKRYNSLVVKGADNKIDKPATINALVGQPVV